MITFRYQPEKAPDRLIISRSEALFSVSDLLSAKTGGIVPVKKSDSISYKPVHTDGFPMAEIQQIITYIVQTGITEFETRYDKGAILIDFPNDADAFAFKVRFGGTRLIEVKP